MADIREYDSLRVTSSSHSYRPMAKQRLAGGLQPDSPAYHHAATRPDRAIHPLCSHPDLFRATW